MRGRQAVQCLLQQLLSEQAPVDEGCLDTLLELPLPADMAVIAGVLQPRQAALELRPSPDVEVVTVQISRGTVERMEEGTRQRMEDRLPAQQAEQSRNQGVFHIVYRCFVTAQVLTHRRSE